MLAHLALVQQCTALQVAEAVEWQSMHTLQPHQTTIIAKSLRLQWLWACLATDAR